jgi:hypothetical protein
LKLVDKLAIGACELSVDQAALMRKYETVPYCVLMTMVFDKKDSASAFGRPVLLKVEY